MSETVNRYRSIVTRLTLMVTGILGAAVLAVGSLALLGQYRQLHHALATKADTMVQFMAQVSPLDILSLNFVAMNNDVKKVVLTDDEAVYAIICNEQGITLVHFFKETDPTMTGEVRDLVKGRKPLAAVAAMKRTGRILEVTAPIIAGKNRLGSAVLGFSTDGVRQALLTQVAVIGMILAAIIASSVALLRVVARRVLQPVQVLTNAANQISTGDLTVVVTGTDRTDELGVLSRAFERMAGQLRELIAGLEQREHDLHRLTLFQRTILDNVAYGIISTDPEGIVSSFNRAAEQLLGYTADEVVDTQTPVCWHDPEEIADHALRLSEELGETIPPGFEVFAARPLRNLPEENEWTFIRKNGTRVPVLLSVTALRDESGLITGFVGMGYDLTERKQTEEALSHLAAIVAYSEDAIIGKSLEGIIVSWNKGAEHLYGYREDEIKGCSVLILIPDDHADELAYILDHVRQGIPIEHFETVRLRKDGSRLEVSVTISPICDKDGKVVGASTVARDISDRKKIEAELRKLNEELEQRVAERTVDLDRQSRQLSDSQQALMNIVEDLNEKTVELELANARLKDVDRLKSMFIASMSHELRTPLNSIIGFSSILHDGWIGPVNVEQKENLAIILRCGKHLLSLINDVIDVSKIEAGKIEVLPQEFDLHDLVQEGITYVAKDIEAKGLDLRFENLHLPIFTDRQRLLQCFLNLLSNAMKFTDQGSISVEVRLAHAPDKAVQESTVEISVTDTGIGIQEEDLPRMFQPFVRLTSPLQSTVPGTGLGLYLTRKLAAEVLKGDILLSSEYGKGSRFTIRIPVRTT